MAITLPTKPVPAIRLSPKLLILYSLPKVGKTEQASLLPSNLILDAEGGAESYKCLRSPIDSTKDLEETKTAIEQAGLALKKPSDKAVPFPYRFITMDTIDKFEDLAEISATEAYKKSVIGKTFTGKSVLELANGGGYYYLRNELVRMVNLISGVCPHLIIIAHVKEKLLDKGGEQLKINDISLTGKLGGILCAMADGIGYMFRNDSKDHRGELWVNFETSESTIMGSRFKNLAGQRFKFDWARIFPDELTSEVVEGQVVYTPLK